jgi:hypothetical protein
MIEDEDGLDTESTGPDRGMYYGKYRGTVMNNIDPEFRGRLLVQVPDVFGINISSWALPCIPFGGLQSGAYVVPPLKSQVWIEFEQGDPDYPIWVGGFWGNMQDVPVTTKASVAPPPGQNIVIQTLGQTMLSLSDNPAPMVGGITLKTHTSMINITDSQIILQCGLTSMVIGPGPVVTFNTGTPFALVVK